MYVDMLCFGFGIGFAYAVTPSLVPLCRRPREVLDLCSGGRLLESNLTLFDIADGPSIPELRFSGTDPRMFLPDPERSRPIAPAAEPLEFFSAATSSSARASLSHQNSHDRESLERPLLDLCKVRVEEDGVILNGIAPRIGVSPI
jgi:hypothetical protein